MICLLVEDDFLIALQIQMLLEEESWQTLGPVASSAEALAALDRHPIDGAILDFSLGRDDNSISIADELLERRCPFAFVTGQSGDHLIPRRFDAVPRLSKPFRDEHLRAILRKFRG